MTRPNARPPGRSSSADLRLAADSAMDSMDSHRSPPAGEQSSSSAVAMPRVHPANNGGQDDNPPSEWSRYQKLSANIVIVLNHHVFRKFILSVIFVNAICIGVSTYDDVMDSTAGDVISRMDQGCLAIFIAELLLHFIPHIFTPRTFFHNPWNVFDLVVVGASVIQFTAADGSSYLTTIRVLRVTPVLRAARFKKLRLLVGTLVRTSKAVVYPLIFMVLLMFVWGIMAVELFGDNDPLRFSNLGRSMTTLFQLAIEGEMNDVTGAQVFGCDVYPLQVDGYCTEPHRSGYWAVWFFGIYLMITANIVLNLFIAVILDAMQETTVIMHEEAAAHKLMEKEMKLHKSLNGRADASPRVSNHHHHIVGISSATIDRDETERLNAINHARMILDGAPSKPGGGCEGGPGEGAGEGEDEARSYRLPALHRPRGLSRESAGHPLGVPYGGVESPEAGGVLAGLSFAAVMEVALGGGGGAGSGALAGEGEGTSASEDPKTQGGGKGAATAARDVLMTAARLQDLERALLAKQAALAEWELNLAARAQAIDKAIDKTLSLPPGPRLGAV